ncbi:MAG: hypothetical protein QG617_991 [Campylobacterota bacterium]|nr:hypothetical protein [Campylobacterota bacterium]
MSKLMDKLVTLNFLVILNLIQDLEGNTVIIRYDNP